MSLTTTKAEDTMGLKMERKRTESCLFILCVNLCDYALSIYTMNLEFFFCKYEKNICSEVACIYKLNNIILEKYSVLIY